MDIDGSLVINKAYYFSLGDQRWMPTGEIEGRGRSCCCCCCNRLRPCRDHVACFSAPLPSVIAQTKVNVNIMHLARAWCIKLYWHVLRVKSQTLGMFRLVVRAFCVPLSGWRQVKFNCPHFLPKCCANLLQTGTRFQLSQAYARHIQNVAW